MHELTPVTPVNFFQIGADIQELEEKVLFPPINSKNQSSYRLPDTAVLCGEESFAEASMGWHRLGLAFYFKVNHPIERSFYPEVDRGDSIEVFIDTRDLKTSGYNTRFCHHFFFLPETFDGIRTAEITRFRTDDRHELCDPALLKVKTQKRSNGYELQAWVPKECLVGYDPDQFERLGFTYRINRNYWASQHFSVVSEDYRLEEQPSLWSQVQLK